MQQLCLSVHCGLEGSGKPQVSLLKTSLLLVLSHKSGLISHALVSRRNRAFCFKAFVSHSRKKLMPEFPVTRLQSYASILLISSQSHSLFCTAVQYQVPKGEDEL